MQSASKRHCLEHWCSRVPLRPDFARKAAVSIPAFSALAAAGFDANACTLVDSSEDLMGLQYTQLIPVLVKAVQELTARLEAVEAA